MINSFNKRRSWFDKSKKSTFLLIGISVAQFQRILRKKLKKKEEQHHVTQMKDKLRKMYKELILRKKKSLIEKNFSILEGDETKGGNIFSTSKTHFQLLDLLQWSFQKFFLLLENSSFVKLLFNLPKITNPLSRLNHFILSKRETETTEIVIQITRKKFYSALNLFFLPRNWAKQSFEDIKPK